MLIELPSLAGYQKQRVENTASKTQRQKHSVENSASRALCQKCSATVQCRSQSAALAAQPLIVAIWRSPAGELLEEIIDELPTSRRRELPPRHCAKKLASQTKPVGSTAGCCASGDRFVSNRGWQD
jgi:hypothetical protein